MQTQEKTDTQIQVLAKKRRRPLSLLIGVGLLTAIILFVGYNVTTLANQHIHQTGTTTVVTRTSQGSWERVLDGYSITSLVAAQNNAAVLYACGIPAQNASSGSSLPGGGTTIASYALLRSSDGGTRWREVTRLSGSCQLAINPTNSDDLYTVALAGHQASNGQVTDVLKHSSDGGHSWTDIAPTLIVDNTQLAIAWHVRQLSMVGTLLFGTQQLPAQGVQPLGRSISPSIVTRLSITRLVESSDGGHTWVIIDNNRENGGQGTRNYVVSPTNAQTIYELAGTQWPGYLQPSMPKNSILGGNLTLYKTVDGGKNWAKLLENLSFNSKIQVASGNPATVYVGSTIGVTPLKGYDAGQDVIVQPHFSLQTSVDGGTTWRTVAMPKEISYVQNWFSDVDGRLYASTGSAPHIQPIATTGTATVSSATAQIGPGGYNVGTGQNAGTVTAIQRYNQAMNTWSVVTQTPPNSSLITVTTNTDTHKSSLWISSSTDGRSILYRQTTV